MRELTVLGLIIGAALIISAVISSAAQIYFSPYQSCLRTHGAGYAGQENGERTLVTQCMMLMNGKL